MQFNFFGEDSKSDVLAHLEQPQIARNSAAAEHLVCADLLRRGVDAFIVSGQRPFDIVVEAPKGLFRLQVKSCSKALPGTGKYRWGGPQFSNKKRIEHRNRGRVSQNGLLAYQGLVDGIAFVALDILRIRYVPIQAVTFVFLSLSAEELESQQELSWKAIAEPWGCYKPTLSLVK